MPGIQVHQSHCNGRQECAKGRSIGSFGRVVHVQLKTNRRIFTPLPRHSWRWSDAYKHRFAVERVFSRIDGAFGFEKHTIRGIAKMEARIGLALLVNVCMALGRIRLGQEELIRSLVAPLPQTA